MPTESFTDVAEAADAAEAAAQEQQSSSPEAYNPMASNSSPSSAIVPATSGTVGAAVDLTGTGIEGEVRRTDINIPKMTLVNAQSKIRGEDDPPPLGSLIFSDSVLLSRPEKQSTRSSPIEIFVLSLVKGYQQDLPFGSPLRPARANRADEVRAMGGTLDRQESKRSGKPLFIEAAQILTIVPAPANLDEALLPYFRLSINDKNYAKALFFVKSIAYTNVAKPIISRVNDTGEPLINTAFLLHTEFVKTEKFSWWTPKIKSGRLTTPEEREWLASKK